MKTAANHQLLHQLSSSQIYKDYERAFSAATGLPLTLRAVETWQLAHRGKKHENPFCVLMAQHSRTCAACLEVQEKIAGATDRESKTVKCFAGLCDTAVPLMGTKPIGFLQTGQVFLGKPDAKKFGRVAAQLLDWGLKVDLKELEEAYFQTRVLTLAQYKAMIRLLAIFSRHLSIVSNQIWIHQQNSEPSTITNAKQFIEQHQSDDVKLKDVAKAVNTSTFYFCKLFKKATGLTFTEYLSRVRVEKAKNLLLNPNLRVSEIAYAVGFQSLTQFNRIFRRVVGCSPTAALFQQTDELAARSTSKFPRDTGAWAVFPIPLGVRCL